MPIAIGLLSVDLRVPEARTLKDKRQVLMSLLDRIGNRFNVSVAEVGRNDSVQHAQIAVACVANRAEHVRQVLDAALGLALGEPRAVVDAHSVELY